MILGEVYENDIFICNKFLRGPSIRIGRKADTSDISFPNDKSISREHAQIIIEGSNSLYVIDAGSKFRTYVNGTIPCLKDTRCQLSVEQNNTITFGANGSKIVTKRLTILCCPTRLEKVEKDRLKSLAKAVGVRIVKDFDASTTHVICNKFSATVKILAALVFRRKIVTIDWLLNFSMVVTQVAPTIPSEDNFFPPGSDVVGLLDTKISRDSLLRSWILLLMNKEDSQYVEVIKGCGGSPLLLYEQPRGGDIVLSVKHLISKQSVVEKTREVCLFLDDCVGPSDEMLRLAAELQLPCLVSGQLASSIFTMSPPSLLHDLPAHRQSASQQQHMPLMSQLTQVSVSTYQAMNTQAAVRPHSVAQNGRRPEQMAGTSMVVPSTNAHDFVAPYSGHRVTQSTTNSSASNDTSVAPGKVSVALDAKATIEPAMAAPKQSVQECTHVIPATLSSRDKSNNPANTPEAPEECLPPPPVNSGSSLMRPAPKAEKQDQGGEAVTRTMDVNLKLDDSLFQSPPPAIDLRADLRMDDVKKATAPGATAFTSTANLKVSNQRTAVVVFPTQVPTNDSRIVANDSDGWLTRAPAMRLSGECHGGTDPWPESETIERPLSLRGSRDVRAVFNSINNNRSAFSTHSNSAVSQSRDVRKFRKNLIRQVREVDVICGKDMIRVLPKESVREIQLRMEMQAEELFVQANEELFADKNDTAAGVGKKRRKV